MLAFLTVGAFLTDGKEKLLEVSSALGVLVMKDGAGGGLPRDVVPSVSIFALVGLSTPDGPYLESYRTCEYECYSVT